MDDIPALESLLSFQYLPRSQDPLLQQLWIKKRLRFEGNEGITDPVDYHCAQLICASLSRQQPILIILPDHAPRRIPLLFATGLILHTVDFKGKTRKHRVLYFGTSASIKNYLAQSYIRDQRLSEIFREVHLGRTTRTEDDFTNNLPEVVFSYAPANAKDVLNTYQPQWIFLDCGDGEKVDWIHPLLNRVADSKLMGIACIQNPLSSVISEFADHNWCIYSWATPPFQRTSQTKITPYVIGGEVAQEQSKNLLDANIMLSQCARKASGKLQRDAFRSVARYCRSVENLAAPLAFHEAESKHFWGIHAIHELKQTAMRFTEEVTTTAFGQALLQALMDVDMVHEQLAATDPPLWQALEQICVDPLTADVPMVLVFQSQFNKQLFTLAMLAINNIAEHELQGLNVWVTTTRQYANWQLELEAANRTSEVVKGVPNQLVRCHPNWNPILVGAPTMFQYARYAHLMSGREAGIMILPHQLKLTYWHINKWIEQFDMIPSLNTETLLQLTRKQPLHTVSSVEPILPKRITVAAVDEIPIDAHSKVVVSQEFQLYEPGSSVEEYALLIEEFDDSDDAGSIDDRESEKPTDATGRIRTGFVEQACVVRFKDGYKAAFALDDRLQVVVNTPNGRGLQVRSVRSLRSGDSILLIDGQQRRGLYDLIVSRIHDHPSIALHISLIERWQDELVKSFKYSGMSVADLYSEMRQKNSKLETDTAIRYWLLRKVMAPTDREDLKRVADVLDMPFVSQYYRQIDRAARRLRGIHRSLARRLNTWLERKAFSSDSQAFNAVVDEELGLEFQDFQESLMILTVESITYEDGLFLVSDLGKLQVT